MQSFRSSGNPLFCLCAFFHDLQHNIHVGRYHIDDGSTLPHHTGSDVNFAVASTHRNKWEVKTLLSQDA